jgi:hypothetical protein
LFRHLPFLVIQREKLHNNALPLPFTVQVE